MNPQSAPFLSAVILGLIAWTAVSRRYIWPHIRQLPLPSAAEPILYLHLFRFIGLAFIAPGVVDASLDPRWAGPAAYGDVFAGLLAGLALLLRSGPLFKPALWAFNLWGIFDLLRAAALGPVYAVPPKLHATFFIPTLGVPLLLCTHGMVFALLIRELRTAARLREGAPS
mgnify:CR=1 FL=1